jgi:glyoxylase-like metal-dependent hydrolase (beta-lactamase superfamily II)
LTHILIPAHNASTWTGPTGNNTYLLPGRVPTLIDAGVGKAEHVDAIARELGGRPLALVLLTHGHPDHASGVPAIAARWPDVSVRQYGTGAEPIADACVIDVGDATVTAVHTPGHAPDHVCFVDGTEVFCGDLARAGGTIVIPAGRGGDLTDYLASLERVRCLRPARLLPGHGPIIENPDAVIDGYVRHRAQRDHQILSVLNEGPSLPDEISSRIYGTLAPELTKAAAQTVLAHLIKLAREGRVVERDGRWELDPGGRRSGDKK